LSIAQLLGWLRCRGRLGGVGICFTRVHCRARSIGWGSGIGRGWDRGRRRGLRGCGRMARKLFLE